MGNAQKWSVGLVAAGVLLSLGFLLREDRAATRGSGAVERGVLAHAAESEDLEHDVPPPDGREGVVASEPLVEGLLASPESSPEQESQPGVESVFEECLAAIEESVFDRLDAQSIIDAALISSEFELDPQVILDQDPTGRPRFRLSGAGSDVDCEFIVAKAGAAGEQVLALEMKFEAPSDSDYLVGSAIRESPKADLQVWFNEDGSVRDFVIMTHLDVSPRKTQETLGARWDSGTFSEGVLYHFKAGPPREEKLKTHGIVSGDPSNWGVPLVITRAWNEEDLNRLSERLLGMYSQVNPTWRDGR